MDEFDLNDLPSFVASRFTSVLGRSHAGTSLNLTNLGVTDDQIEAVASRAAGAHWNKIWLSYNKLTDVGLGRLLKALVSTNQVQSVEEFSLASNRLSDNGVIQIIRFFKQYPMTLQVLDLSGNKKIGDGSMNELADLVRMAPKLHKLCLLNTSITDSGALALLSAIPFSSVQEIRLSSVKLTDYTANHLLMTARISQLTTVVLTNAKEISEKKLDELRSFLAWKNSSSIAIITALCGAHIVPRAYQRSTLCALPRGLEKRLVGMLYNLNEVRE